jgi:hypothetical protein
MGKPFACEVGLRYVLLIATTDPLIKHTVAIDESCVVFDSDPGNENLRKNWSEYNAIAMLEFRPL